jgi:hypothetical protein
MLSGGTTLEAARSCASPSCLTYEIDGDAILHQAKGFIATSG